MYKITIQKLETENFNEKEYQKIADSGNTRDGGPVYEYVVFPSTRVIQTTILEQNIEELNVPEVIKAINGLQ